MENDEHFRKAFKFFDKDESGYIELIELEAALVDDLGETDTNVLNEIMREVDTDKVWLSFSRLIALFCFLSKFYCHRNINQGRYSVPIKILICSFYNTIICCFSSTSYSILHKSLEHFFNLLFSQDGRISYEEFVAMMKTGTDWRKASRQYSRERFKSLSINLMKDGSLQLHDEISGQAVVVWV